MFAKLILHTNYPIWELHDQEHTGYENIKDTFINDYLLHSYDTYIIEFLVLYNYEIIRGGLQKYNKNLKLLIDCPSSRHTYLS